MNSPHGDVGGMGALANGVLGLGSLGLLGAGAIVLVVSAVGRSMGRATSDERPAETEPAVTLATATVVSEKQHG